MLFEIFKSLNRNRILNYIRDFFNSNWYLAYVGVITLCSNLFGIELAMYWLFVATAVIATLFARSTIAYVPLIATGYITVSYNNNPGSQNDSFFYKPSFLPNILAMSGVVAVFLISRFVYEVFINPERDRNKKKLPSLTFGFVALGIVYIFAGLFSRKFNLETGAYEDGTSYSGKNALFGLVQIVCLALVYFYMYYSAHRKDVPLDYFTRVLTMMGLVLVVEVCGIYFNVWRTIGFEDLLRGSLRTGWGLNNNVGGMLALTLPGPMYYIVKGKKTILAIIATHLIFVATIFTQSRSSILGASVLFIVGMIVAIKFSNKHIRKELIITLSIVISISVILAIIFRKQLLKLFNSIFEAGLNDSGRFDIYLGGLKQFIKNPILGNGFYECTAFQFGELLQGSFIPPRYHNTIVQILACCGSLGILAYGYHRFQTIKLTLKNNNLQGLFVAIFLIGLLLPSMFDNFFFNIGPALVYSPALFFAEVNKEHKAEMIKADISENVLCCDSTLSEEENTEYQHDFSEDNDNQEEVFNSCAVTASVDEDSLEDKQQI